MKKSIIYILLFLLVVISCGSLVFAFYGNTDALVVGDLGDPQETVTAFFAAMAEGEYSKANEYINNYDSLGFENQSSEIAEHYKQAIAESYKIDFVGECTVEGLDAVQDISITFLDWRKLLDTVSEKAQQDAMDYIYEGNLIEDDDRAKQFTFDAIESALESPQDYYSKETVEIHLIYGESGWRINIDEVLMNILFGYI